MKTKHDLAGVFLQIEQAAGAVERISDGILAAVKNGRATTIEQFNDMVAAAYQINGWSQRTGRPPAGSTDKPAPSAVKLYVSNLRLAYRLELDVLSFSNMYALRMALADRMKTTVAGERPPELRGLQVSSENAFNGALLHDVVVLYEHLPDDEQTKLERRLRRLYNEFVAVAPPELAKAS